MFAERAGVLVVLHHILAGHTQQGKVRVKWVCAFEFRLAFRFRD